MTNRIVFTYASDRVDEDVVEDVKDFLDAVAEGEWEIIAWVNKDETVFLISAPVQCRTLHLEPEMEMGLIPLSVALMEMDGHSNEWLEPPKTEDNSPVIEARDITQRWFSEMFDDESLPDSPVPVMKEPETPKRTKKRPSRKRSGSESRSVTVEKRRKAAAEPVPSPGDPPENEEPDPEASRRAAERKPAEESSRSDANDLMAKFGLTGALLQGSDAANDLFVWSKDEKDSDQ